jgi:hypothetical protein
MVGGGGNPAALPDQVIPNSATQRLIAALTGNGTTPAAFPRVVPGQAPAGDGYVNFVVGDHGSLLNPAASAPATGEMQGEALTYTATVGSIVPGVVTPLVVQP